jgi:hypothetical protein
MVFPSWIPHPGNQPSVTAGKPKTKNRTTKKTSKPTMKKARKKKPT